MCWIQQRGRLTTSLVTVLPRLAKQWTVFRDLKACKPWHNCPRVSTSIFRRFCFHQLDVFVDLTKAFDLSSAGGNLPFRQRSVAATCEAWLIVLHKPQGSLCWHRDGHVLYVTPVRRPSLAESPRAAASRHCSQCTRRAPWSGTGAGRAPRVAGRPRRATARSVPGCQRSCDTPGHE